jgi:hypothetical protein
MSHKQRELNYLQIDIKFMSPKHEELKLFTI